MSLVLHNTRTRKKEPFRPIDPSDVRLYVCGPTVWNYAHIGNGRTFTCFDLLYRVLCHLYGKKHVRYVRNITDIEDKIIEAALANGETIAALTERTTAIFQDDMASMNCLAPSLEPRATDHVDRMIGMIERLIESDHAYESDHHVLFSVESLADYGSLSGRNLDEMIAGARVEVASYKRSPGDFVLWKPSHDDQPGWTSPWGRGRPGWHIECSAMCEQHLGEHFDIHGGGIDLIFPHHENEIAQSVCAHAGRPFVNVWMHASFLDIDGEKMSKSLGNVLTVHDLVQDYPGEVLRWALFTAHYRDPMDWTEERLAQSRASLDRLYSALRPITALEAAAPDRPSVLKSLEDDLNTPQAQAVLHELASSLNKANTTAERSRLKGDLLASGRLMGLLNLTPEQWFHWSPAATDVLDEPAIDLLIKARVDARNRRDFAEADRIRKQLVENNISLEDGPDGTIWRRTS